MPPLDPLESARALLTLARLIHRSRHKAGVYGVQPAPAAVARVVPIGRRLAAAVRAAETATTDQERVEALQEVMRAGEQLSAEVDGRWEGIPSLIAVALDGVEGREHVRPGEEGAARAARPRDG